MSLLVLLIFGIGLLVFPSDRCLTLAAVYISNNVSTCGHGAFFPRALRHVDNGFEEESPSVLALKRLADDLLVRGKMGLTAAAREHVPGQVCIMLETHLRANSERI